MQNAMKRKGRLKEERRSRRSEPSKRVERSRSNEPSRTAEGEPPSRRKRTHKGWKGVEGAAIRREGQQPGELRSLSHGPKVSSYVPA